MNQFGAEEEDAFYGYSEATLGSLRNLFKEPEEASFETADPETQT
jgi:hypothetical protein